MSNMLGFLVKAAGYAIEAVGHAAVGRNNEDGQDERAPRARGFDDVGSVPPAGGRSGRSGRATTGGSGRRGAQGASGARAPGASSGSDLSSCCAVRAVPRVRNGRR